MNGFLFRTHYLCLLVTEEPPQSFTSVGCWKDTGNRAIATLEGQDGRLDGSYGSRANPIEKCYEAAKERGFKYFAVQNGGWCASTATASETYKKYGGANNCQGGEGGAWANDVYKINYGKFTPLHHYLTGL